MIPKPAISSLHLLVQLALLAVVAWPAASSRAGTTVVHVETERGGIVRLGGAINANGAVFWHGTGWATNDTYGHMYFVNVTTGKRLKTFTTTVVSGTQPLGRVLTRDGYAVDRGTHVYAKPGTAGGAFFVEAVSYEITGPDGKKILLLSRSTGRGATDAAFDVLLEDPDQATTTTGLFGDPTWFTIEGDIAAARAALPDEACRSGDLPSVGERYFLETDGGSEMGGLSYTFRTHAFGPADAGIAAQATAFIADFSIQYTDASGALQDVKLLPAVISETPARYDAVVPAAANVAGANSTRWQSDLDLFNPDTGSSARVELALLKANQANATPKTVEVTVAAGQTLRLANVLGSTFSAGNAAIAARFLSGRVGVTSRFYNTAAVGGGTFGMAVPGERPAGALTERDNASFQLLSFSGNAAQGFRVNVGFASHTARDVDVEVGLMGDDGTLLKVVPVTLKPYEHRQLTRIHAIPAPATGSVGHGFATVRVLTPASLVHAYAMLIDNVSGDPIYLQPRLARPVNDS